MKNPIRQLIVTSEELEPIIKIGKLMKANVVLYNKNAKTITGFSQDGIDANILRIFHGEDSLLDISKEIPNMVILNKDLISILKTHTSTKEPITLTCTNYYNCNDYVLGVSCNEEYKLCFNFFDFMDTYKRGIGYLDKGTLICSCESIETMEEFYGALHAKASDGIQRVIYNDIVLFIPSTFINANKGEAIDLNIYENDQKIHYILEFIIHKKKGDLTIIYKILKL